MTLLYILLTAFLLPLTILASTGVGPGYSPYPTGTHPRPTVTDPAHTTRPTLTVVPPYPIRNSTIVDPSSTGTRPRFSTVTEPSYISTVTDPGYYSTGTRPGFYTTVTPVPTYYYAKRQLRNHPRAF